MIRGSNNTQKRDDMTNISQFMLELEIYHQLQQSDINTCINCQA